MDIAELTIDEEFRRMIPPLSEVERNQLEQNLLQDGCREPLVVWAVKPTECWSCEDQNLKCGEFEFDIHDPGDEYLADYWSWECKTCDDFEGEPEFILLDGHNRFEICQRNGIKFDVCYKLFETREQAADWIDANQLGRRNLSAEQMSFLRGRRYNRTKKDSHCGANQVAGKMSATTAESLAAEHGVDEKTIRRDGKFAEAVEVLGMESEVSSGEVSAPKSAIVEAAKPIVEAIKAHEKWEEEAKAKPLAVPPEPPLPTADDIQKAKAHVSHNSGQNEWYTPPEFIESARNVFGGKIDCDPASCEIANATVQASVYYTKEDDGLSQKWRGHVWMNPPYAQPLISQFSDAVTDKYLAKEIKSAIVLVNNATETAWFQRMVESSTAICFPKARIKFMDPQGNRTGAPLQGQAILYMGNKANKFILEFCKYGFCVLTTEFRGQ